MTSNLQQQLLSDSISVNRVVFFRILIYVHWVKFKQLNIQYTALFTVNDNERCQKCKTQQRGRQRVIE